MLNQARHCRGFTWLDALITVFVIGIGLLAQKRLERRRAHCAQMVSQATQQDGPGRTGCPSVDRAPHDPKGGAP